MNQRQDRCIADSKACHHVYRLYDNVLASNTVKTQIRHCNICNHVSTSALTTKVSKYSIMLYAINGQNL